MRRVPITVYLAEWCPVCVRARAWMRTSQLSIIERNIETDDAAKRELRQLNSRGSVPTIVIDGQAHIGFSAQKIWHALAVAARREIEDAR
jgi:glutaredoxin